MILRTSEGLNLENERAKEEDIPLETDEDNFELIYDNDYEFEVVE